MSTCQCGTEFTGWDKTLLPRAHIEKHNNPEGECLWETPLVKKILLSSCSVN